MKRVSWPLMVIIANSIVISLLVMYHTIIVFLLIDDYAHATYPEAIYLTMELVVVAILSLSLGLAIAKYGEEKSKDE